MICRFRNKFPEIDESVFVAENAVIIGDVIIGTDSSIWYNSVIRGDVNFIRIGSKTNIQDGSILHVSSKRNSLEIGNNVTVGHNSVVHGCIIRDNVLIGMGSVILDGAEVKKNSIVAAGSLVKESFEIPEGVLAAGVPARIVRKLTEEEILKITESACVYADLSRDYKNQ